MGMVLPAAFLVLSCIVLGQGVSMDTVSIPDSSKTERTLNLKAVKVSASRVIAKGDRQLFLPAQTAVKNSSNGFDLLKRMMLPGIKVDETNQSISSTAGCLHIRINDIKAEKEDILSLRPDEVVRVE